MKKLINRLTKWNARPSGIRLRLTGIFMEIQEFPCIFSKGYLPVIYIRHRA